jgi:hypothetical protein
MLGKRNIRSTKKTWVISAIPMEVALLYAAKKLFNMLFRNRALIKSSSLSITTLLERSS